MNHEPRILYVDDEDYMLDCMAATFEIAELTIATAASAHEAQQLLENNPAFKIVISDYRMPGMNGIDFLSQVAAKFPNSTRILCSAYIDGNELSSYLTAGTIHHFIRKPWDINNLIGMVCTMLDTSASVGEEAGCLPKFMPALQLATS